MKKDKNAARINFNIDFNNDIIIDGKDFINSEIIVFGDRKGQIKQIKEEIYEKTKTLTDSEKIKLNLVFKQLESIMLEMSEEVPQQKVSMDQYKIELYYSPAPQLTTIMRKQKR